MRFCELENSVNVWKNEKSLSNRDLIDSIYKLLDKNFKILQFSYDFSRFFLFKIKLYATKPGLIARNKYLNFDIEIKSMDQELTNETQSLGILNYSNKKYQVRVGQLVIFYITDIYG